MGETTKKCDYYKQNFEIIKKLDKIETYKTSLKARDRE